MAQRWESKQPKWHMYKKLLVPLINISREVGQFLKAEQAQISASEIEFKGSARDLVSRADKEAEKLFVSFLENLIPEAGFIAEEGTSKKVGEVYNWIIDPLDGTTNYLHGIPCYCTSVALMKGREMVLGVIYDPVHDECFSAAKGQGAQLNGLPIAVSDQTNRNEAFLATGFPYDNRGLQEKYLRILGNMNTQTRGIRRLGSAALDLAYVACGRFDGFYEYGLQPWDCAAGILIIEEAGGKVSEFDGGNDPVFGLTMLSSNGHLHDGLSHILEDFGHD